MESQTVEKNQNAIQQFGKLLYENKIKAEQVGQIETSMVHQVTILKREELSHRQTIYTEVGAFILVCYNKGTKSWVRENYTNLKAMERC